MANKKSSMALFHATTINNLESIMQKGLIIGCVSNYIDVEIRDEIYLAFNPECSICYVETSDLFEDEEIVVFRVKLSDIDEDKISYDWNNICWDTTEINSVAYLKNIPPECLSIMTREEIDETPSYSIEDFNGSKMYDTIMETFYLNVKENMEEKQSE